MSFSAGAQAQDYAAFHELETKYIFGNFTVGSSTGIEGERAAAGLIAAGNRPHPALERGALAAEGRPHDLLDKRQTRRCGSIATHGP